MRATLAAAFLLGELRCRHSQFQRSQKSLTGSDFAVVYLVDALAVPISSSAPTTLRLLRRTGSQQSSGSDIWGSSLIAALHAAEANDPDEVTSKPPASPEHGPPGNRRPWLASAPVRSHQAIPMDASQQRSHAVAGGSTAPLPATPTHATREEKRPMAQDPTFNPKRARASYVQLSQEGSVGVAKGLTPSRRISVYGLEKKRTGPKPGSVFNLDGSPRKKPVRRRNPGGHTKKP